MITIAQLRRKAENRYRDVLKEMLRGGDPFPLQIRYPHLKTSDDLQELRSSIQAIKSQSKSSLQFGYTVTWIEIDTRRFGRNAIPSEMGFASAEDFFGYIGRQPEASEIFTAADLIRERYPEASDWPVENIRFLSGHEPAFWEHLFRVVDYLRANPFPDLYARELPVQTPTKFMEENRAILESFLQAVAPQSYRPDGETFAERLGLRSPESLIEVRLLDPSLAPNLPLTHFTAAASQLTESYFGKITGVLITENRLTFLTLPPLPGILAIHGQGYAITRLRRLPWLANHPLFYWGDIDVEGFEILANLRRIFPHTRSVLMDAATLKACRRYAVTGSSKTALSPSLEPHLTPEERSLANELAASKIRLEQERIPLAAVSDQYPFPAKEKEM